MTEREAFEAHYRLLDLTWNNCVGLYHDPRTAALYNCWCVARAALAAKQEPVAWQCRWVSKNNTFLEKDWFNCTEQDFALLKLSDTCEIRALYTAAPTSIDRPADLARKIAAEQAEDEGLWFVAETAPEAYLQAALRRLTAAVEGDQ